MNNNAAPGYEKIGDKQYHHFTIQVSPGDTNNLIITLTGDGQHDLNLYARFGGFAFEGEDGVIEAENDSTNETLEIENPQSGTWYIGVKGVQTVDTTLVDWGWAYTGHTEVLNGVPYTILVSAVVPNPPPAIAGVAPSSGRTNGGTLVAITGSNFVSGC